VNTRQSTQIGTLVRVAVFCLLAILPANGQPLAASSQRSKRCTGFVCRLYPCDTLYISIVRRYVRLPNMTAVAVVDSDGH